MKNVLIINEPNTGTEKWIRTALEKIDGYQISRINSGQLQQSKILEEIKFEFIIFQCESLGEAEINFLKNLPESSRNIPFVILAEQIAVYSYGQVHSFQNIVTLQTPCDPQVFQAIIERIRAGESFKPEVAPRFITNQPVRIVVLGSGLYLPTRMRNYSASGAFLEYHGISLKVGDRIQINLGKSNQVEKKNFLLMEAKVVWIREGDRARSPARGVGVQFLPAN